MAGKTIKDVARALGVSPATVSRALAGNPRISFETRKRVAEAAKAVGYMPNRAAQSLVGRRSSGFAGLVLTDPGYGRDDSYLGEFLTGLGQGLAESGIDLFLAAVPEDQDELAVIRNIVATRRADGLILARTMEDDPRVDFLLAEDFPFVTHGRIADATKPVWWVDSDGAAAFAEAFQLLCSLGHRRLGLMTMDEPATFRHDRTEGLTRAIAATDPSVTLTTLSAPRFDTALRHAAARKLLGAEPRPTAILCLMDGFALDVLYEARAMGLSVPEDLSVIGYDDIPSAERAQLTTFDSDAAGSARQLAQMLARRIDPETGRGEPETHLVRPRLMLRGTHGPAPAG